MVVRLVGDGGGHALVVIGGRRGEMRHERGFCVLGLETLRGD